MDVQPLLRERNTRGPKTYHDIQTERIKAALSQASKQLPQPSGPSYSDNLHGENRPDKGKGKGRGGG